MSLPDDLDLDTDPVPPFLDEERVVEPDEDERR